MRRRTTTAALAGTLAALLVVVACSDDDDSAAPARTTTAAVTPTAVAADALPPGRVVIADFTFIRPVTTVGAGTEVTWENADPVGHTVTGAGGIFDSGRLEGGATFTHTFDTPGEFAYFCSIHNDMTGKIVVTG